MGRIIGLHGIFTTGKRGFDRGFLFDLNQNYGYLTLHPSYACIPGFSYVPSLTKYYVDRVLAVFCDGDHILAHSAGCVITYFVLKELKKQNRKVGKIFFLNSALNNDTQFPEDTYDEIYNFHEDDDTILHWARYLPSSIFGNMGRDGYKGTSENVTDITEIVPN